MQEQLHVTHIWSSAFSPQTNLAERVHQQLNRDMRIFVNKQLGSAPSTIELAFASAQRALYDTAALLAASWRAGVASPPAGQSAVQPAAPGGRAAQGGRQRARRGRGGQGKKRGAS